MVRKLALVTLMALPMISLGQLWSQPENSGDGYYSDGYSTNGSQYPQTIADNFSIASASTVTSIQFWGTSSNNDFNNFASFDIYVFDSTLSNVVFSVNAATASLNPVATGNQNSLGGLEYTMTLNTNFNLAAGNYWLSIGSVNTNAQENSFAWSYGGGQGDGQIDYNIYDGGGWYNYAGGQDEAFIINGQPVPEPATLTALGLGALAFMRRRKQSAR